MFEIDFSVNLFANVSRCYLRLCLEFKFMWCTEEAKKEKIVKEEEKIDCSILT